MKVFYLQPITDDMIMEKLHHEMEGEILHYEKISSRRKKEPYEIGNELDLNYLEHARGIINDVGEFIRGFLPRFLSPERANFDYVRKHNVEFLSRHRLLLRVRVRTDREEKEISLSFDLPSFVYIPRVLLKIKERHLYLHDHLKSSISFVIGDRQNPKTDDYFVDDAMEELWHLAIHPYLIEKLNRNIRDEGLKPDDKMSKILMEGEHLAKAFACVSIGEFREKKRYTVAASEAEGKEKILVDKITRVGIKGALKRISRSGILR